MPIVTRAFDAGARLSGAACGIDFRLVKEASARTDLDALLDRIGG
jgi:hypothetical protein